jgi:alpha-L-fucosidase
MMLTTIVLCALSRIAAADPAPPDIEWWRRARLGMFVHWGLYSEAGGVWKGKFLPGWSEWMLNRLRISPDVYHATLTPRFDPSEFDADAWVRAAKEAGMEYIVITTKHHDGFANWPSAVSTLDIAATHFGKPIAEGGRGRDPLLELSQACARQGLRLGFYYSLLDWAHPDYLPRREWDTRPTEGNSYHKYAAFMKEQVRELLDGRYGKIAILWGDGNWEHSGQEHRSDEIIAMARELQPGILVNDRWSVLGDYETPENKIPEAGPARPWETCMTLNDSWGYARDDHNFKSAAEVLKNLAEIVSKGGNYLLNIGPDGKGRIDPESIRVLDSMSAWMKTHGASIHGNGVAPLPRPDCGVWTLATGGTGEPATLNLHLFTAPAGAVRVAGVIDDPTRVLVPGGEFVAGAWRREGPDLVVDLDASALAAIGAASPHAVLSLEFAKTPRVIATPILLGDAPIFVDSMRVEFAPPTSGTSIHVTTDGSDPASAAALVADATGSYGVELADSALVRARSSWQGHASSAETSASFTRVEPSAAQACDGTNAGLNARVLLGSFEDVPSDAQFAASKTSLVVEGPSIPRGLPEERFAIRLTGLLKAPERGVYRFELTSDDGSELWIDGKLVVDNGGLHGATPKSGDIALAAGCHAIDLRMFESVGSESLSLRWRLPNAASFTAIPSQAWSRRDPWE